MKRKNLRLGAPKPNRKVTLLNLLQYSPFIRNRTSRRLKAGFACLLACLCYWKLSLCPMSLCELYILPLVWSPTQTWVKYNEAKPSHLRCSKGRHLWEVIWSNVCIYYKYWFFFILRKAREAWIANPPTLGALSDCRKHWENETVALTPFRGAPIWDLGPLAPVGVITGGSALLVPDRAFNGDTAPNYTNYRKRWVDSQVRIHSTS